MAVYQQWIKKISNRRRMRQSARLDTDERIELAHAQFAAATTPGVSSIYSHDKPVDCQQLEFPISAPKTDPAKLRSSLCTRHQLDSAAFRFWTLRLQENWRLHRKIWEFCFIMQALYERVREVDPGRPIRFLVLGEIEGGRPAPPAVEDMAQWESFVDGLRDPAVEISAYKPLAPVAEES